MVAPRSTALQALLEFQSGVITRQQVFDCGLDSAFVRSMLRRGRWVRVSPGVYITHTGPRAWRQRAWIAVLSVERGALSHQSAICAANADAPRGGPIHLVVGRKCRAPRFPGVVVHRCADLEERVHWNAAPPRVRIEHAVLDVAAEASREVDKIAHLADAVQARLTTADRLLAALAVRGRYPRRRFTQAVLSDIAQGTCSALEHGYLTKIERQHGLPGPRRQSPTTVGRHGYRDVEYDEWGLLVELDGLLHITARARDNDLERDLDAAVGEDRRSIRLGWGQVYERPCSTAGKVATMLGRLGWPGAFTRCPRCQPER
ncbi:MAG: hypothetical protein EKK60_01585 [Gordonia sp. (in: high G+C Gram-positive bacteria)]|nr:MAG: hypothetical protein EKK60_01585 [Gordonia sp. (in: high G+C Gram-positive bacteria)]